ncbi:hypothetical protein [Alteromonas halophila]|uniref:Uncharacterized protein n=1 Tax=Alteromonas halophila TaxID=516698 RepID=A0A918MZD1_9ALTE|nr:hypothetical protein [Alteromonas halophila]GGW88595.1 hypothetical protein GCM10007391_23380 [Alteromonas halophila]
MIGLQATLVSIAVGALATGYFYVQTLKLESQISEHEKALQYEAQLAQTYKDQVNEQKRVISTFEANQAATQQQLTQLTQQKDQADERTRLAQQEILTLRSKEKQWALQDPYGSGGRAASRLDYSMQRITGATDNDRYSKNYSRITRAGEN